MSINSISLASETWSDSCLPFVVAPAPRLVASLDDMRDEFTARSKDGQGPLAERNVVALLGGKGANLAALRAAGLPVPAAPASRVRSAIFRPVRFSPSPFR